MVCRKHNILFTRILALIAILAVVALSWATLSFMPKKSVRADEVQALAQAQPTHDLVFGANHADSKPFSLSDDEIVYVKHSQWFGDDYYLKSCTFHLTEDVVLSSVLEMLPSYFSVDNLTVNICLHGHSITYPSSYAIGLYGDSTLNIYDCGGDDHGGSIRGLYVANGAVCNMYGGGVKDYSKNGVSVTGTGGANNTHSMFNMYGGEISGNGESSLSGGGGVCVGAQGVFNMYGGTICNNTVEKNDGAGVFVLDASSTFHMYGGSITNNTVTFNETAAESDVNFYGGAGVYVCGGTFTVEGNVNISGNVKGKPSALSANNVEMTSGCKIGVTGALASGSHIGVTAPVGVITSGYTESGNTQNPSVFFNCDDSGYSISFDEGLGKEAAVFEGEVVVGNYTMTAATATSYVGTPGVGDTSIGLNITVTLENDDDHSTKTVYDAKTVNCSALHVGDNIVEFDYEYKGVTKHLSYTIHLDKVSASVNWTCAGATATGTAAAERIYDGSNALSGISASYTGYDGQTVTVSGTSLTVKKGGATVNSIVDVGVYTVSMPASDTYDFSNGAFTLTVKEAPIDEGYYTMRSATAVVNGTYTAGATTVNVTVTATLRNTVNYNDVTTATESKQITVPALHAGSNPVTFTYVYTDEKGGTQTAQVSVTVTAAKKQAAVGWYFNGTLGNAAQHTSNGINVLGDISAKYAGLDGQTVTVDGLSGDIIVKNSAGATVDSIIGAGVYTVTLAEKADYQFTNNSFTLTVSEANVDDGYYRMTNAVATGIVGSATVGDREITVTVKVTLEHTKNHDVKENTVNYKYALSTPLHVGNNTVAFTYDHAAMPDDVQHKELSLTVNAGKKRVTLKWYYNGDLAADNTAVKMYDGIDAGSKVYAEYDGYDGEVKRVDGTSSGMIIKDADGNTVSALQGAGIYMLSLADSADYVFSGNLLTFTVAENIGDISDFTYEEDDDVILGVSCGNGLEQGTEMKVEWVDDLDDNIVIGQINSALNVSFVNNAVEVTPTGTITVRVLIPDDLKGKNYKIYNLNNGIATEVRFTTEGEYATFTAEELSTILFVTQDSPFPTPTPDGGNGAGITLNNSGMVWVWVSVAIIAAALAIMSIVIVVMYKRNKK